MDPEEIEQPALEAPDALSLDDTEEVAPPAAEVSAPDEATLRRQARSEIEQAFAEKARRVLAGDREAIAGLSSWERRALGPVMETLRTVEQSEEQREFERTLSHYDEVREAMEGYARESDYLNTLSKEERQWFHQFRAVTAQMGLADNSTSADIRRALDAQVANERAVALRDVTKNSDPWDLYDELAESDSAKFLTPAQLQKLNPENFTHLGTNIKAIKAMYDGFYRQVAEAQARQMAGSMAAEAGKVNGRAAAVAQMAAGSAPSVASGRAARGAPDLLEAGRNYRDDPSPENRRIYEQARADADWN